jgi:aminopeptidase N
MNNANQDNLWHELTLQGHADKTLDSNLSIKTIMDSWTLKMGYPVVNIQRLFNSTENTVSLLVSQKWFLLNPLSKLYKQPNVYETNKWYIPFTYTTKSELNFAFESRPFWIEPIDAKVVIKLNETNVKDWYIGNIKHTGFYRVNYDEQNWNLLIKQLNDGDFNLIDETSKEL